MVRTMNLNQTILTTVGLTAIIIASKGIDKLIEKNFTSFSGEALIAIGFGILAFLFLFFGAQSTSIKFK